MFSGINSDRSNSELEDLKANWLTDPCFDIEDAEGFETYHDELLIWRLRLENERMSEQLRRIREAIGVLFTCGLQK